MYSILIGNIKGGCGKTTIATHLAGACAGAGFVTALADCDRQRSSLNWLRRRGDRQPAVTGLDWAKDIGRPPHETQRLVIDAPAALRGKAFEELLDLADVVVVPVLPSAFDEDASARFVAKLSANKAVRKGRRLVAVVGNRLRPGTKAVADLDARFGELGYPLAARLRDSQFYAVLAAEGSTVLESPLRRARDHVAEWQPLLALLGLSAGPR
jgi:chromosome partitioning protein